MKTAYKHALTATFLSLLVACGGGGGGADTTTGGTTGGGTTSGGTTSGGTTGGGTTGTTQAQSKDYTKVTEYTKIGSTLINAVNLVNEKLLATPSYLDDLFTSNSVVISVPIQNYFGSDVAGDMTRAEMLVTTLKYDFPVQGTANRKPYRLKYSEYDSAGKVVYSLSVGSIYGCSNANDIKNPTAECVVYNYSEVRDNIVQWSASSSISLVKTEVNGLVYLSNLLP